MDPAPVTSLLSPDVQTPDSSISLSGGVHNTILGLIVMCGGIWGLRGGGEKAVSSCMCTSFILCQSYQKKKPTPKLH